VRETGTTSTAPSLADALERVLARPSLIRPVFQPIVDLRRGVVAGYEALARFGVEPVVPPDHWFAAARVHGLADELEAAVLAVVLEARHGLPPNRFLTVNADPNSLLSAPVERLLRTTDELGGVFLELTEHRPIGDGELLRLALDDWRRKGARIAVDDAGSGYAGLTWLLELKPDLIKLDRALVANVDVDEAKRAMVEMVGALAGRLDAWILAEGIERVEELEVLVALGVPLGQGWALGHPGPQWRPVDPVASERIQATATRQAGVGLLAILELRPTVSGPDAGSEAIELLRGDPALDVVAILDDRGRPKALLTRTWGLLDADQLLLAGTGTIPGEAALRAITRAAHLRFTPITCCDEAGRFVGVVPFERLVAWLAVVPHP
jgi:EAL domain-containing protein (putative c-di-GMP-specific phosphodiesterase class I)